MSPHQPASRPLSFPRDVARACFSDRVMMVAAGLAFFGAFGLLPAIAAAAVLYGYLLPTETLRGQLTALAPLLPDGATELLAEALTEVPARLGVGLGLLVQLAIVLWTVQRSASGVITALNMAYEEEERRRRMRRECVALAIALSSLLVLLLALCLVAAPPLLEARLDEGMMRIITVARWPTLALLFMLVLGLLYVYAPCDSRPRRQWLSWGAVAATALWVGSTALFSLYLSIAGQFGRYYGSMGAAIVLLTWLFITAFVVMAGAELNAMLTAQAERRPEKGLKRALDRSERGGG